MWSARCWVKRKGSECLQWGDLSPWTSVSPGTPGDPCRTTLVCIYGICFLQIFMNEWEVVLFIISEVKDFMFSSEGLRNAGTDWTVNLGGFMEDWAYLAVLSYFIRKVFLPNIELGALKIKEEVISKFIYNFFFFFLVTWFQTPSNVEKDRWFRVLDGRILMSFRKLQLS